VLSIYKPCSLFVYATSCLKIERKSLDSYQIFFRTMHKFAIESFFFDFVFDVSIPCFKSWRSFARRIISKFYHTKWQEKLEANEKLRRYKTIHTDSGPHPPLALSRKHPSHVYKILELIHV